MEHIKERDLRVRMSDHLYRSVYRKAQENGMNLSEYIRYVLTKEMEK